jgi:hypothetical protein
MDWRMALVDHGIGWNSVVRAPTNISPCGFKWAHREALLFNDCTMHVDIGNYIVVSMVLVNVSDGTKILPKGMPKKLMIFILNTFSIQ